MNPETIDTIDPLLSVLPAPWLAAIEAYAPTVLAWLLAITVLVHLLVPISRAVERWAVASSVTWDDGPARRFAEIVEWLAGATRAVLAFLPRLAIGGLGQRDVKPENVSQRPRTMRPPPSDAALAIGLLILAAALSAASSGCSSGPQLPVVTVPMSISCTWTAAPDGGHLADNDCLIDRSSAQADSETTGNRARDVTVSPQTSVSAIPGVGQ